MTLDIYISVYMLVCVCVFVCVRKRGREGGERVKICDREKEKVGSFILVYTRERGGDVNICEREIKRGTLYTCV